MNEPEPLIELPMFPLGTVLMPAMPLPLRVFEPRYLQLLQDVLSDDPAEFGIVLIERGHEVGGGDQRSLIGTVAEVMDLATSDEFVTVMVRGGRRVRVVDWLPDDPYPQARVEDLPTLTWDPLLQERREQVEQLVRDTLARAGELEPGPWTSTVELSTDPVGALWQLAAIAPLGEYDRQRLLACDSAPALLDALEVATRAVAELIGPVEG